MILFVNICFISDYIRRALVFEPLCRIYLELNYRHLQESQVQHATGNHNISFTLSFDGAEIFDVYAINRAFHMSLSDLID